MYYSTRINVNKFHSKVEANYYTIFKVLMRSHCAEIIKDEHKNVHLMGEFKVN